MIYRGIMKELPHIVSDEATDKDLLGRAQYATAMARIAETASTPLVVGLYGYWGTGKTTLMHLIDKELNKNKTRSIWFDPWLHQNDESPVLSLVHTMVSQLKLGEEGRKLLTVATTAFGSMLLKATTNINVNDIMKIGKQFEKERFQVRDAQVRLREYFSSLIKKARGGSNRRLVFFIDDLDRCSPKTTLSMLEALKLYFNLDGCMYFLCVDRSALIGSIKHHYGTEYINHTKYLDKIVQLPFVIPPIHISSMQDYVDSLLSGDLKSCEELLINCLGDNPRDVKRFINLLTFNHMLAIQTISTDYDVKTLAALLLVQYIEPDMYSKITSVAPEQIKNIIESEMTSLNNSLHDAFELLLSQTYDTLSAYLYFTSTTTSETVFSDEIDDVPSIAKTKMQRKPSTVFMEPMNISEDFAAIVGSKPISRIEITKKLWAYIKKNNLQDKKNKRMINADAKLKKVFKGKGKVSMFEMTKLVSKHISSINKQ